MKRLLKFVPLRWKLYILGGGLLILFQILVISLMIETVVSVFGGYNNYEESQMPSIASAGGVSADVLRFEEDISSEMQKQGLDPSWLPLLLAHVMVESGGNAEKTPDIFQASEFAGRKPNSLTTPESIHYGVACMKSAISALSKASGHDLKANDTNDVNLTSDYYNFSSLSNWMKKHGVKKWSLEEHNQFYAWAGSLGAGSGDISYYLKILEYYDPSTGQLRGALAGGSSDQQAETAVKIALAQRGKPYVWGATGPDAFDCSGLVIYSFKQAGYTISGRPSSQQMYQGNANFQRINRNELAAGDLIFFRIGGGGSVDHVGIYIGNNQMVNAETDSNPLPKQIESVNVFSNNYWKSRIAGYGRVVRLK